MPFNEDYLPYVEAFFEETAEQLQNLEDRLVSLEKNPDDQAGLEDIFRIAHTLKGNAATVGFERISRLAHHMEDLLDGVRKGRVRVSPEITDALLNCLDALKDLVEEGSGNQEEARDITSLMNRLEQLADGASGGESPDRPVSESTFQVEVVLEQGCAMRAARAYVVMRRLAERGKILEAYPSFDQLQSTGFEGTEIKIRFVSGESSDLLIRMLFDIPEVSEARVLPLENGKMKEVRVEVGPYLEPQLMADYLKGPAGRVVVDLSQLNNLSPAGLSWLISAGESPEVELVYPQHPVGSRFFQIMSIGQGNRLE